MRTRFVVLLLASAPLLACSSSGDDSANSERPPGSSSGGSTGTEGGDGGDGSEIADGPGTPTFSDSGGDVPALTQIEITCEDGDGTAYYTTDGTTPTEDSEPASGGITIYEDVEITAVCIAGDDSSGTATETYTPTPLHPDFELSLESGMRWNFHYEYDHWVGYSYFGDSSFSSEQDFSIVLGENTEVDGLTAYEVIVVGDFTARWEYLAADGYRLYGSNDLSEFVVLFDAMLGFWVGDAFFLDFDSDSDQDLLSAEFSGDVATIAAGWSVSDDDTAYYPGVGTIYDPDAWSASSSETETYQAGVGPAGYRTYSSFTDEYEASSDTRTVTLTSLETGVDYTQYSSVATLAVNEMATLTQSGTSDTVEVDGTSGSYPWLIFVQFTEDGYDPVLTVTDQAYETVVEGVDDSDTIIEILETEPLELPIHITVEDASGQSDGEFRVTALAIDDPDDDGNLVSYVPSAAISLDAGSWMGGSLEPETFYCFDLGESSSDQYYFFAFPLTDELDLAMALVDDPEASTTNHYRAVNANGAGQGEVFIEPTATSGLGVNVFDADYDTAGDFVFGWGMY